MPGNVPSSRRPTTFDQNPDDSRLKPRIRSNQLTKMPANSGIMIAQRNGLLRAHTEQNLSQPIVGSAHSAYTGIQASMPPTSVSGLAGPQIRVIGLPPCSITTMLIMVMNPISVATAAITASTGATIATLATFDSTVWLSDSGNDFQNSTLRSLRSSYSVPRQ